MLMATGVKMSLTSYSDALLLTQNSIAMVCSETIMMVTVVVVIIIGVIKLWMMIEITNNCTVA